MAKIPVALQLFTVRDDCDADFKGTLKQVAQMGYQGVEFAGNTGGMSADELKKFIDDLGIKAFASHTPIEQIAQDVQPAIDFALEVGSRWIVCPYLGDEWRKNAEGYKKVAEVLEKAGARCADYGLGMCYHNHSFEFTQFDGKYGFDILYENSNPNLVKAELDTYWVKHGGEEPQEYIRKYSGRVPLVHLKDMAGDEEKSFAEIGEGILDFEAIFAAAEEAGTECYIVEQDVCKGPALESAKLSIQNLKKMGVL